MIIITISLSVIKNMKGLENIGLIKQPRLAVMPVSYTDFEMLTNILVE